MIGRTSGCALIVLAAAFAPSCSQSEEATDAPGSGTAPSAENFSPGAAPAPPGPDQSGPAPASASSGVPLAIDGEGLRLFNPDTGAARPLPFGTARADLLAALASRGPPTTGRQEECGAGPLDFATWSDGLKLYFQSGKFAGWAVDQRAARPGNLPAVATAAGIGPGSSRSEVEDAITITVGRSTLGTEFRSGAISGLFDGPADTALVTAMWAGASCNFR